MKKNIELIMYSRCDVNSAIGKDNLKYKLGYIHIRAENTEFGKSCLPRSKAEPIYLSALVAMAESPISKFLQSVQFLTLLSGLLSLLRPLLHYEA